MESQGRLLKQLNLSKDLPQNFLSQQKLDGPILLISLSLYKIF